MRVALDLPKHAFGRALRPIFLLIRGDALGQGVAMDPEDFCGVGEMLSMARQSFFDIDLFKFGDRLIQKDLAVQHLIDQGFKFCAHLHTNGETPAG